jgi:Ca-activated chloride channel homolog
MRLIISTIPILMSIGVAYYGHMQTPTIRADVNLVQVHVKVTDPHGRVVTGLEKQAFELLVDNVKQEITLFQSEDAPVCAGIVVDNSASMGPKRKDVIQAATEFARDSNPLDEMFVVHFNDRVRLGLPPGQPFTSNIEELTSAISKFELGGTTALYNALIYSMSHLHQSAYHARVLLAITDGGDNSSTASARDVVVAAEACGAVIFAIGVFESTDEDRNPAMLKDIAEATGGAAFFPQSSAEIPGVCKQIAREIRHQYTLGFAGATDGRYHSIRVLVRDPRYEKLEPHARAGYLAAGKSE